MKRIINAIAVLSILTIIPTLPVHAALTEPCWELGVNDWGMNGPALLPPAEMLDTDQENYAVN